MSNSIKEYTKRPLWKYTGNKSQAYTAEICHEKVFLKKNWQYRLSWRRFLLGIGKEGGLTVKTLNEWKKKKGEIKRYIHDNTKVGMDEEQIRKKEKRKKQEGKTLGSGQGGESTTCSNAVI